VRKAVIGADAFEISKALDAMSLTEAAREEAFALVAEYYDLLAKYDPDSERGRATARLHALFFASWKIQDFKGCLAIQKEINKLQALYT
jgi:hypothetical protein